MNEARSLTLDKPRLTSRQRAREAAHFEKVRLAEHSYGIALRKIARHVGDLIRAFHPWDAAGDVPALLASLRQYSEALKPWARASAARMLAETARRDEQAWFRSSEEMGRELRALIREAPLGDMVRQLQADQVQLITSLPLEAAQRVQTLAADYAAGGRRYDEMAEMLADSGRVSLSRATLIARTEVGKASAALTQARAKHIGSDGYVWRTARDPFVRKEHKHLEGTFHRWDDPPIAEASGERHHPGNFPNCRCYAEPIIPGIEE